MPVFSGEFSPMLRHRPRKYTKYSSRPLPCLDKNLLRKNCMHISASKIREIFVAANAALLTQGKDNKTKSAESGR